ncbi:MAG: hypothetical protein V5A66_04785 [Candidatus Thermoplasmatota archaeon]
MSNLVNEMLEEIRDIRPKRFKRLVMLDLILKEYAFLVGVDYEELVERLRPTIVRRAIAKLELDLTDELEKFILGVTDEALEDYIKMLKYFRGKE